MAATSILVFAVVLSIVVDLSTADTMRKSIVWDPKTPKVFYCPQEKPIDPAAMIVKARPLEKLCEFDGSLNRLPEDYRSDCYNDLDETEYACAEKARINLRLNPPADGEETTTVIPTPDAPPHIKEMKKSATGSKPSKNGGKSKKH